MVFYSVIFMLLPYYCLHRIVEVVGDSWRYLAQPLAQNNQLEQVAPNIVQLRFDSLQRRKLCNVSGQHVPVLGHAHGKKGFVFCLSNCELIHNLFLSLMHTFVFTRRKRECAGSLRCHSVSISSSCLKEVTVFVTVGLQSSWNEVAFPERIHGFQ